MDNDNTDEPKPVEEHPLLTAAEIEKAKEKARARVTAEAKTKALKDIEDKEILRLQHESGLVTGETFKDEMVWITLDLAPYADRIRINWQDYYHGHSYNVPRHFADSMREIQARSWAHQDEIDGKSLTEHFQRQLRGTAVNARTGQREVVKGMN